VPTCTIQRGQLFLGRLPWIEQGGHHHDDLGAKARLGNANSRFTNRDCIWQRPIGAPIQGTNP
jgi:hypothetical protein